MSFTDIHTSVRKSIADAANSLRHVVAFLVIFIAVNSPALWNDMFFRDNLIWTIVTSSLGCSVLYLFRRLWTARLLEAAHTRSPHGFALLAPVRDHRGAIVDFSWRHVNPALLAILQVTLDGVMRARTMLSFYQNEAQAQERCALYRRVLETGAPLDRDMLCDFGAGARRWMRIVAVKVGNNVAISLIDISHRGEIDQTLQKLQDEVLWYKAASECSWQEKSRVVASIGQHLRQPVQALLLFTATLKNKVADEDEDNIVENMGRAIDDLKMMLDGLQDISGLDTGAVKPHQEWLPLDSLLCRLKQEYETPAHKKGLTLTYVHTSAVIDSDRRLLERLLRILLDNALRYTEAGGVLLGCRRRGTMIRIDVIDTGIGISDDHQTAIFEEYYQIAPVQVNRRQGFRLEDGYDQGGDRRRGLGLGLSIAKRLAVLLGCDLEVASRPGQGSRFSVRFPLTDCSMPWPRGTPQRTVRGFDETILLIEADPVLRLSFKDVLDNFGYHTIPTPNSAVAIDLVDAGLTPDAIIVDDDVHDDLDSVTAIRQIQALVGLVPALLLLGDTPSPRSKDNADGRITVVHKPVAAVDLHRHLSAMLDPALPESQVNPHSEA